MATEKVRRFPEELVIIAGTSHFLSEGTAGSMGMANLCTIWLFNVANWKITILDTGWGPPVISWFIRPSNYSYKYHKR